MPEDTEPWGIVSETADGKSVIIQKEYLDWLASMLAEDCHCGPHMDHDDCLAEVECFIKKFHHMVYSK